MNLSLYPPSPYLFLQPPPVILLKEGTDKSQGVPQLISNSNACQVIAEAVRTTLGPRGMAEVRTRTDIAGETLRKIKTGSGFNFENSMFHSLALLDLKGYEPDSFFYRILFFVNSIQT
uniref:Uncharacterized protein n=1 Tax=Oncorhynchus mykiss TaxID=8022 RepID=A0A8C7U0X3_ONCMY